MDKVYPKVHYKQHPDTFIVIGCNAYVYPIDHYNKELVSNTTWCRTSPVVTVQYHNSKIVAFFTKNTHYILETK